MTSIPEKANQLTRQETADILYKAENLSKAVNIYKNIFEDQITRILAHQVLMIEGKKNE